ncbi:hypothetical protein A3L12_05215 [Thermococcus sp. P6]|uniref:bifunctional hydroxymethylpyrimidine kinase/phosphomethylpyrimidine kinase n=1 Tax=Thermococcus sp. P6 TaxID=122420 RepID=UPI000B5A121D|nr:bifunctional hydroxymethylpyrimidine kinase/phosphomethylpyrimidine kinase [Thermococcus sp. P6]ASJ10738.1 hypothetical protein A3L12_05215 [Thermococcus sp. P6]
MRTALTIAGSDSGGGAGIEADLKTFASFGVHGLVAVTAVTAQNTLEVRAIHGVPPEVVAGQIEAVVEDIGVDAAKTGMLGNGAIVRTVAEAVEKYSFPLVVDPVMVATSGRALLEEDAVEVLKNRLIPLASVVTPNVPEAERLTGIEIKGLEDARRAARFIVEELGAGAAVVKGGHLRLNEAVDVLYHNGRYREYRGPLLRGCTHGTGCSFSAAITANLALGRPLEKSVREAKRFVTMGIRYGIPLGHGPCPVNQNAWRDVPALRWRIYEELSLVMEKVGDNAILACSPPMPYGADRENVAVLRNGRITFGAPEDIFDLLLREAKKKPGTRCLLLLEGKPIFGTSAREVLERAGLESRR